MSASKLIEFIRQQNTHTRGIELATVIQSSPLAIRVDNMEISLSGDDLIVCEHLTRHERIVTLEHIEATERILGDGTGVDLVSGSGGFTVNDEINPPHNTISTFRYEYIRVQFEDVLKSGDRVAVMALPGEQQYLILDRVVIADG